MQASEKPVQERSWFDGVPPPQVAMEKPGRSMEQNRLAWLRRFRYAIVRIARHTALTAKLAANHSQSD
jgi:hypothetical protein